MVSVRCYILRRRKAKAAVATQLAELLLPDTVGRRLVSSLQQIFMQNIYLLSTCIGTEPQILRFEIALRLWFDSRHSRVSSFKIIPGTIATKGFTKPVSPASDDSCSRIPNRDKYYKNIFALTELPYNYSKILMHCVGCSVSFQVDMFVLATKD